MIIKFTNYTNGVIYLNTDEIKAFFFSASQGRKDKYTLNFLYGDKMENLSVDVTDKVKDRLVDFLSKKVFINVTDLDEEEIKEHSPIEDSTKAKSDIDSFAEEGLALIDNKTGLIITDPSVSENARNHVVHDVENSAEYQDKVRMFGWGL